MIERFITDELIELTNGYPIVTLTGPRQSGKSTLLEEKFKDYEFVSLEDLDIRKRAVNDPRGFLEAYDYRIIIDEAQYAPDLFSYIQTKTDKQNTTGQYILSGSQNFLLMDRIKQSLAGRVAILKLLPLSYRELSQDREISLESFVFSGGYPRIYDKNLDSTRYYDNYISTYLDRDVRTLIGVNNINGFNRFLVLCAVRAGQPLNITNLSEDSGISINTIKSWLNVLESSYIIKLVYPYFANLPKRLIKSPKLYFLDSGLLCYLLGIKSEKDMLRSNKYYGNIFESFVFSEFFKRSYNRGENNPRLYFYRDSNGNEIDLIEEINTDFLKLFEIKSSKTMKSEYSNNLNKIADLLKTDRVEKAVIYQGSKGSINGVDYLSATDMLRVF